MFNHVEQWIKSIVIITDMTIIVYNIYFKNKTCRLQNLKTEITHFRLHKQIIKGKGETRVLRHVGGGGRLLSLPHKKGWLMLNPTSEKVFI